ncbi:PEP-CTERM sorting domain-containing protein [Puniceicoccus vermicola]|uniref:PEP-CTERM sorting domain-containing protein n=1 Tax=Puniceicoccus vermicola TaxID=388746 RepID=A0A7X1E4V5_9BACT|nr:PEP-CTERM sorting domain-containing protein [Puniceicoccus vermicola]MBC2602526.1 PEP-CTERM sorting domain-containing protein [Puniceicoccus vermicola]
MKTISKIFLLSLFVTGSASAALLMDFAGGGSSTNPSYTFTMSDLTTTPSRSGVQPSNDLLLSGTLAGVTGTIDVTVQALASFTMTGVDISDETNANGISANSNSGWGVNPNSPLNNIGPDTMLAFTFDLGSADLPAGFELAITRIQTGNQGTITDIRMVVDGISDTEYITTATASGSPYDGEGFDFFPGTQIANGTRVGFALGAGETDDFRLDEMTLSLVAVPEPSSLALMYIASLAGLGYFRKRR